MRESQKRQSKLPAAAQKFAVPEMETAIATLPGNNHYRAPTEPRPVFVAPRRGARVRPAVSVGVAVGVAV